MSVLNAFKLKPFDLEPILQSWADAPRFTGKPKKGENGVDVDGWLESIKAGCVQRQVPKEYWHKVAQHYMSDKARARLEELKKVMSQVHGGRYRWDWKKFKIAMRNMGWSISTSQTEPVVVQSKSGSWWTRKSSESSLDNHAPAPTAKKPKPTRQSTVSSISSKSSKKDETVPAHRPPVRTATSDAVLWISNKMSSEPFDIVDRADATEKHTRPSPKKSKSDGTILVATRNKATPPVPTEENAVTMTANAPTWLLNACTALDFLQNEHPKVMTTMSALLITIGSIPAIPAIHAGAGGVILASGAAQAVGAIAVGVGNWMRNTQNEGSSSSSNGH